MLDEPKNVMGEKQIGKFRSGDIRFDPKVRIIKRILLKSNKSSMYLLDELNGVEKVVYTKNELQVILDDEMAHLVNFYSMKKPLKTLI